MERLTERFYGWVIRKGCHGPCRTCHRAECADIYPMIDRLAAYEDTGLEPEDIVNALKTLDLFAEEVKGVPLNRIRELAQAEKDGRLVVPPPNDPLTPERLREMDEGPVWISGEGLNWWDIFCGVSTDNLACFLRAALPMEGCGKTWAPYRRKPEAPAGTP